LNDLEKSWLQQCDQVDRANLMDRHRHNLPQWLVDALQSQGMAPSGPEFWSLVKSLSEQAPLDLRVNDVKTKVAEVQLALTQANLKVTKTPFSPLGLRLQGKPDLSKLAEFKSGAFEIQDEGSQLLAVLLDAKRGEMVVDFCAGAGGKTLAIGASMRNSGRLYAFDTSAHRLEALKPRLARSGLSNVHPVAIAHERDDRIKRLAGKVDRVLVDAPCSGLGTLRRHPDLKWRQTLQIVQEMAVLQAAILKSAARMVKSGGRLVYATCSLLQQENEDVALAFSRANPDFQPQAVSALLGELKVSGATALCSPTVFVDEAAPETGVDFLRLWPHRHQTDGFFAAVWQKK
jgi:16S rRNA (cytosine967-C5)-methyltransferase